MNQTILVAGGDRRQTLLAALLEKNGPVCTLAVPERPDVLPAGPVGLLVLPCPAFSAPGSVRSLAGELKLSDLKKYVNQSTHILGGALEPGNGALAALTARSVTDLLRDPVVALENARLTAEACLMLVMAHTERSVHGKACVVLGYGRIGSCLARLLHEYGAGITVLARNAAQRELARANGCEAQGFDKPLPPAELVFNTVPAPALSRAALLTLTPGTLWVELASRPGGLPADFVPPFAVLGANNLPGRLLPASAAEVLMRGIVRSGFYNIINKE